LYIIKLSEPHKRMKDVELVLRFLAFQHQSYQNYKSPMKRFLNNEMAKYRNLKRRRKKSKKSVSFIKKIFDKNAFSRFIIGTKEKLFRYYETNFNNGLYDILMWSFVLYNEEDILSNRDVIKRRIIVVNDF
jgi:hypothetical protein